MKEKGGIIHIYSAGSVVLLLQGSVDPRLWQPVEAEGVQSVTSSTSLIGHSSQQNTSISDGFSALTSQQAAGECPNIGSTHQPL